MKLKIELYILSLWVLFGLLFIDKIEFPICFGSNYQYIGTWQLLKTNWIPAICILGMIYGRYAYWRFKHRVIESSKQGPWQIAQIENVSFENLSFLATFIIPMMCFILEVSLNAERNLLMLFAMLFIIGWIYIKTNMFYTNPTLALLGFHIYRIIYTSQGETKKAIVLSIEKLIVSDKIFASHIDENIYFTKKHPNE